MSSHTLSPTYRHRFFGGCFSYPDVVLCSRRSSGIERNAELALDMRYSAASVLLGSCSVSMEKPMCKYVCKPHAYDCLHTYSAHTRTIPLFHVHSQVHTCAPWWPVKGLSHSRGLWLSTCPQSPICVHTHKHTCEQCGCPQPLWPLLQACRCFLRPKSVGVKARSAPCVECCSSVLCSDRQTFDSIVRFASH